MNIVFGIMSDCFDFVRYCDFDFVGIDKDSGERKRESYTHRDTETERERERDTDTQPDRQTPKKTQKKHKDLMPNG
jgi:hypothetical protein